MHECPECGCYCFCHGDIDDLPLPAPDDCYHPECPADEDERFCGDEDEED